jgi:hypothetical protein
VLLLDGGLAGHTVCGSQFSLQTIRSAGLHQARHFAAWLDRLAQSSRATRGRVPPMGAGPGDRRSVGRGGDQFVAIVVIYHSRGARSQTVRRATTAAATARVWSVSGRRPERGAGASSGAGNGRSVPGRELWLREWALLLGGGGGGGYQPADYAECKSLSAIVTRARASQLGRASSALAASSSRRVAIRENISQFSIMCPCCGRSNSRCCCCRCCCCALACFCNSGDTFFLSLPTIVRASGRSDQLEIG